MNWFSQLNAYPSLQVTWACDGGMALSGFEVGPFSQLNALTDWAVLGHNHEIFPARLLPGLRAKCPTGRRDQKNLNRRSYLHVSDEPRTTRGSVHLEHKF